MRSDSILLKLMSDDTSQALACHLLLERLFGR